MTKNQECLEAILCHLTKLILLMETGDIKELQKLIDMAVSISAQLSGVIEEENNNKGDEVTV